MTAPFSCPFFFFFNDTATTEIYTLSLHDALPILHLDLQCASPWRSQSRRHARCTRCKPYRRSEEHTSELQSPCNLVCRLLLEKKQMMTNVCPPALGESLGPSTFALRA